MNGRKRAFPRDRRFIQGVVRNTLAIQRLYDDNASSAEVGARAVYPASKARFQPPDSTIRVRRRLARRSNSLEFKLQLVSDQHLKVEL